MIGWVVVSLEAAALAAVVAALAALVCNLALEWIRFIRPAARRADAAFLLGLIPMLVAVSLWGALLLPSALHVTGVRLDHCELHSHHAHLCALHAEGVRLFLIALGVLALGSAVWRGGRLASAQARSMRLVATLEKLGVTRGGDPHPVIAVPGSPWLCLAAGGWRRRVLMSASITSALTPLEVQAALAHEQAHLSRNDPLLKMVLAWAGLFSPPWVATAAQRAFGDAAEEASDAEAAETVGPLMVAESLVSMARLTRAAAPATCLAFGGSSLERRVASLLSGAVDTRPPRSVQLALGVVFVGAFLTTAGADSIHHAAETLLQLLG